jgi:hypothetical protein
VGTRLDKAVRGLRVEEGGSALAVVEEGFLDEAERAGLGGRGEDGSWAGAGVVAGATRDRFWWGRLTAVAEGWRV